MAASVTITLDTTGPQSPDITIDGGAAASTDRDVSAAITTSDPDTTGYQVKIWGDVDESHNANIQEDEGDSAWITLASPHTVRVSTGDGVKTLHCKIRDSVHNVSAEDTDTINLDMTAPVVTANAPSPALISKQATKDTSTFTWSADAQFEEFKIKVVSNAGDGHTSGVQIPTTAGSTDMSGAAGSYPASTNRTASIKGTDLETASATDGAKIVKVFVKDAAGNWSV